MAAIYPMYSFLTHEFLGWAKHFNTFDNYPFVGMQYGETFQSRERKERQRLGNSVTIKTLMEPATPEEHARNTREIEKTCASSQKPALLFYGVAANAIAGEVFEAKRQRDSDIEVPHGIESCREVCLVSADLSLLVFLVDVDDRTVNQLGVPMLFDVYDTTLARTSGRLREDLVVLLIKGMNAAEKLGDWRVMRLACKALIFHLHPNIKQQAVVYCRTVENFFTAYADKTGAVTNRVAKYAALKEPDDALLDKLLPAWGDVATTLGDDVETERAWKVIVKNVRDPETRARVVYNYGVQQKRLRLDKRAETLFMEAREMYKSLGKVEMEIMCIDSLLGLYKRDTFAREVKVLVFYESLTPEQKTKCKWSVTLTRQTTTGKGGRVIGNCIINVAPKTDHTLMYKPVEPSDNVKQLGSSKASTMGPCSNCRQLFNLERELKKCSVCRKEYYCGIDCQRNHWKAHKKVCQAPTLERKSTEKEKRAGSSATA